jgi:hypothetical protein
VHVDEARDQIAPVPIADGEPKPEAPPPARDGGDRATRRDGRWNRTSAIAHPACALDGDRLPDASDTNNVRPVGIAHDFNDGADASEEGAVVVAGDWLDLDRASYGPMASAARRHGRAIAPRARAQRGLGK